MKPIILVLACGFFLSVQAETKQVKNPLEISKNTLAMKLMSSSRQMGEVIKKEYLKGALREFIKTSRPNRVWGSAGHTAAREYIMQEFAKMGARLELARTPVVEEFTPNIDVAQKMYLMDFHREVAQRFTPLDPVYIKWKRFTDDVINKLGHVKNITGKNIIFEIPGGKFPQDVLVIAANYDTIVTSEANQMTMDGEMPGADDNGSGVVAVLTLANILSQLKLDRTIMFVIFDYQELGSMGAREFVANYASRLQGERTSMINLLMLGHDSSTQDRLKRNQNMKVYMRRKNEEGHAKDMQLFSVFETANKSLGTKLFQPLDNGFNLSDNVPFWEASKPALVFTQDWENDLNPRQHTYNDFPETLNYDTYMRALRYLLSGVIYWSQTP